jgi:hypothetical protein
LSQGAAYGYLAGSLCLELHITNDWTMTHHYIVAMRVELGPEYLYIRNTAPPQSTKRITDKDMLDDPFAKG